METAITGATPAFSIGTTAARRGNCHDCCADGGQLNTVPLAALVQPLATDTDIWVNITGTATGDAYVVVQLRQARVTMAKITWLGDDRCVWNEVTFPPGVPVEIDDAYMIGKARHQSVFQAGRCAGQIGVRPHARNVDRNGAGRCHGVRGDGPSAQAQARPAAEGEAQCRSVITAS